MSDAHAAADIKKEVRTYISVFVALMILTLVTVGVSYLRFALPVAILIALVIACVKGSLVAGFFMHLLHERRLVYWALLLTVVFFVFLMFIPLATSLDKIVMRATQ